MLCDDLGLFPHYAPGKSDPTKLKLTSNESNMPRCRVRKQARQVLVDVLGTAPSHGNFV